MAAPPKPAQKFYVWPKVINGCVAGAIGIAVVFPLDLVKTRLQTQQLGPRGEKMYTSLADCFVKVFKSEGFLGMYRGSAVNIIFVGPEKSVKLVANDVFKYLLTVPEKKLTIVRETISGAGAGAFQILVSTPAELLKIQMQESGRLNAAKIAAGQKPDFINARIVAQRLMAERGIFGLYRGIGITAYRDIGFAAVYFPMFQFLNEFGPRRTDGSNTAVPWVSMLAGFVTGAFSAVIVTPCDVVKTRLQTLKQAEGEKAFTGIMECLTHTYKVEGFKALFKGGLCRLMVIAPLYAIAQTIYFYGLGERLLGTPR